MHGDLIRVEGAVSATASGNLTWERWPHDCAVALGLSGQRNPLGFAVVRYLSDQPSSINTWTVVLGLAKVIEQRGSIGAGMDVKEIAFRAFDFWRDDRCPRCGGRGVVSVDQRACPPCGSTGKRSSDNEPDAVRAGIGYLIEAEQWMEGQLRARMRDAIYSVPDDHYTVLNPARSGAATPKAPVHD